MRIKFVPKSRKTKKPERQIPAKQVINSSQAHLSR